MDRFEMHRIDGQTFVVFDKVEKREICVCSNYDDWEDAEKRAMQIIKLLNAG
jgi:hypothetical protein